MNLTPRIQEKLTDWLTVEGEKRKYRFTFITLWGITWYIGLQVSLLLWLILKYQDAPTAIITMVLFNVGAIGLLYLLSLLVVAMRESNQRLMEDE